MESQLPQFLIEAFTWLERSAFANMVRMTPRLYPILMSLHVLGITMMVGAAFAVDLRLLGFGREVVPVTVATRHLLPMSHAGFVVVLLTGLTMFAAVALTAGSSSAAPWKLGLILLAATNILVFHKGVYRSVDAWNIGTPTPSAATIAAAVSICCWTGVIFAGRFLAY